MGIKRGVSFYSYQQAQFFKQMDWKAMVRELHDNLHTDGVEIIDEATIRDYPFPSDEFIYEWRSYLARYNMKAVTMDIYLDVHQFRDHVMNHAEAAERLKNDIRLAAKLGFANVRPLCTVPIDVIEAALPVAEECNVRMGKEIHAPLPIFIHPDRTYENDNFSADIHMAEQILDLADRKNTKYVGLVPDFGIFQYRPSQVAIDYAKRHAKDPEAIDWIVENSANYTQEDLEKAANEKFPGNGVSHMDYHRLSLHEMSGDPQDLKKIIPYIVSMHGKFYQMTEIEGEPGHYEDKSIDYATPMKVLRENGFEGYIDSEYEGQRDQQDRGAEYLPNEIEEVRRHHEMLARLSKVD